MHETSSDPTASHSSALVIDGHADTPQRFLDEGWDFTAPVGHGMLNLETARAGGLDAQFFALWAEPVAWRGRFAERTFALLEGVEAQLRKHRDSMRLCVTPGEVLQAKDDGLFAVLLGIEGGHSIGTDLDLLRTFHARGVRYMTLTWTNTNAWADSSGDLDDPAVTHHEGLTIFGRSVVREMNRLGMMVDVSHVSDATFWDVLKTTHAPIIASHSSARALTDSSRNLTDEMLRAIATNNGVVMVNFYSSFINDAWRVAWKATEPQRLPRYAAAAAPFRDRDEPVPYGMALAVDRAFYAEVFSHTMKRPPFSALIDHIDHIAKVAGIDHVGLGSDFDGFAFLPEGMETAADLPKITQALEARGYTAEQLRKILGGNTLRVMSEVLAAATRG